MEKILTEIESKDYLLKIQEDQIKEFERRINKYGSYLYVSFFTIFPLAVMGLLYIIEKIEK